MFERFTERARRVVVLAQDEARVLKHGYIPANLHFENPSRQIPFAELNIDVPIAGRPYCPGVVLHDFEYAGGMLQVRVRS